MEDEIKELYSHGNGYVEVGFYIKDLPDLMYTVAGSGGGRERFSKIVWKESGGVEGVFLYELQGALDWPEKWKGYIGRLTVDSWRWGDSKHIKKGYLGDGYFDGKTVLLRLYVKPSIARDILDKLYIFDRWATNDHHIRCHVLKTEVLQSKLDGV
jgi:hypothetical protein